MFHTAQFILQLTPNLVRCKKSSPIPHQQVGYLGILLDAAPIEYAPIESEVYAPLEKEGRLRASLSENRQMSLLQAVCRLNVGARKGV